jgi:nitrate/TMAO reductase-like tetraheme cytochrome c subunit
MSEETPNTSVERPDKTEENRDAAQAVETAEEPKENAAAAQTPSLYRNYISFAGTAIAAAALMSIIFLILIEFTSPREQPYLDLFTYLLFPSILVFGLFIVLVGILFERRRRRKYKPSEIAAYPVLDLNSPRQRRTFLVLLVAAFLFLFISAFGSYRVFEYSESVTFCGQACHVMKPEFTAYNASPHARIACVECHVGGGAEWYLRAKFNGMRQLYAVTFDTYHRPIQTPVHNMRPADDTCAKCHWSEKFHGDKIKIFNHFGYDEKNSLNQTRLLIKVGGGSPERGPVSGIHWHMNIGNEITYIATDEKRQQIPWVRMKDRDGNVVEYVSKDAQFSPAQIEKSPKRRMDCIDCHNRPAHVYLSPAKAVDDALAANKLDVSLPFMKLKAVEVLSRQYNTTDEAVGLIASGLDEYYRTNHAGLYSAKKDSIDNAVKEVQRIYQTYFFPEMKTDWQSHADNIGHYYAQGCFRCHDGQHFSREGKVIRNECGICHTTIDQTFGGKTLTPPNGEFKHPVNLGDKNTWQCAACHKANKPFVHPLNLGDISQFQCAECHKGQSFKMNFTRQE